MIRTLSGWRGVALAAVFLLAAILGWAVNVRCMAEPKIRIDAVARLNELAAARQPEGENALPLYVQARELMREGGFPGPDCEPVTREQVRAAMRGLGVATGQSYSDDTKPTQEELDHMIELLAPIVRCIDKAAQTPGFLMRIDGGTLTRAASDAFESSRSVYEFSAMNRDLMVICASRGDWDSALHHARIGRTISRYLMMAPICVIYPAALRTAEHDLLAVQQMCMDLDMPQDVCEWFLEAIVEERPSDALDIDTILSVLQLQAEDYRQHFYSDDGRGGGFPLNRIAWEGVYANDDHPPRPLARLIALSPESLLSPSRREASHADERELEVVRRYLDGEIDGAVARRRIGDIIWPLFKHSQSPRPEPMYFAAAYRRLLIVEAAAEVVLRLTLHKARTGAWPATLEEAMTREQTLDPNTGDPFGYVLAPEDDEHGRPFLLLAPESSPGRGRRANEWIMNARWPDRRGLTR